MGDEETEPQPVRKSARSTTRKRVPAQATPPTPPAPPPKRRKKKPPASPSESPLSHESQEESPIRMESPPTIQGGPSLDLAGVYAPLLRLRHKRQLDSTPVVSLPPRTIGGVRDQFEKHKVCNCRRSNCLKLYCDCYQAGLHCHPSCNCVACQNTDQYQRQRNISIDITLLRNPNSFRPRLVGISNDPQNPQPTIPTTAKGSSGCNCKKSFCLKKYCECFHMAVYCSPVHCRCSDCQNRPGNEERERLIGKRRSQEKVAAAAAALAHQHSRISGRMAMMGEVGRAYFHHAPGEEKDVEASTAAAAVAAGAVAGGVDLFLPPSSYTIPMTLKSGMPFTALSFATSDLKQQAALPRKYKPIHNLQPHLKWETDVQRLWRVETDRVNETFIKVQAFVDSQTPVGGAKNSDPLICSRARAVVDSLQQDMKAIITAIQKAEENAICFMDTKVASQIMPPTENLTDEALQQNVGGSRASEAGPKQDLPAEAPSKGAIPVDSSYDNEEKIDAIAVPSDPLPVGKTVSTGDEEQTGPLTKDAIPSHSSERDMVIDASTTSRAEEARTPASPKEPPAASDANPSDGAMDASAPVLDDSPLLCEEEIDNSKERALSEDAVRQLTILASQEAVLLGQLAQIIRRKTLDLTRERIRLVKNAKSKG